MTTTPCRDVRCPKADPDQAVPDDQRDASGFLYRVDEHLGAWRLTECCQAAVSFHDATLCCKCCWREVDVAYDAPARFEGDPVTISEPFVVRLPEEG